MNVWLALATIAVVVVQAHADDTDPTTSKNPALKFMEAEVQYTKSQAEKTEAMARNVLQHLPNTEAYDKHREYLAQLQQHAEDFQKPGLCLDKIFKFSECFRDVMMPYLLIDTSLEEREILKLLELYGLKDMITETDAFLERVKSGELGSPAEEGTPDFVAFLEMEC